MIHHPSFRPGTVWLAGAGPGNPALLTLAALHAIEQADVIVHDALVSPEILRLAPPSSRLVAVGKRAGGVRTPQMTINDLLISFAQRTLRVLRLKGGDPFVFGRGGEECLALAASGIGFRVIPGISAGIGGAGAAHLPVTHRAIARSVVFATGEAGAGGHDVDFTALARCVDTIVLYMARQTLPRIVAELIAGGRSPAEPVAFLLDATTPRERLIHTTLADAVMTAAPLPRAATLIIIGKVVDIAAAIAPAFEAALPAAYAS